MESKLQSLKVTELKALLQRANLAQTGDAPNLPGADDDKAQTESDLVALPNEAAHAVKPDAQAVAVAATPAVHAKASEEETKTFLADLNRRRARQARFGESTRDLDAQIERIEKFGLESKSAKEAGPAALLSKGLDEIGKQKKEARRGAEVQKVDGKKGGVALDKALSATKSSKASAATVKKAETPEEAAARKARQEADEAAKASRAKRWGLPEPAKGASSAGQVDAKKGAATAAAAIVAAAPVDPLEEEKKRKRAEKFGTGSAPAENKKVKS
ncbi:SAP domain [Ceraceosorus bombacis]|uniref:SAP domain n=1 Tax=Ceraceosorus bombacis TaxID=401625 RepID=A0A0P1BJB1_9BASI|nr:SAP domain [Ceraceosorus bombacis]